MPAFSGLFKNPYFGSIWVLTMLIQVIGVQYGGAAIAVHKNGITSALMGRWRCQSHSSSGSR